ncbi:MAG: 16S rRNA processing protein RimM [Roseivirga sp.]|jgi:16S rRNA processing protein RimM
MTVDDCYQLGYITKPHGLKGEVQVLLDVDFPNDYKGLESVFVQQGQQLVPFFIDTLSINAEKAIIAFEDINSLELALTLKGCLLYLPLNNLPAMQGNEFYYHEVIGFELIDTNTNSTVGVIENVFEAGVQILLSVRHESRKEVLIPLTDDLINSVKRDERKLSMSLPDGLVDVFLED